jgi:hypothetical protein
MAVVFTKNSGFFPVGCRVDPYMFEPPWSIITGWRCRSRSRRVTRAAHVADHASIRTGHGVGVRALSTIDRPKGEAGHCSIHADSGESMCVQRAPRGTRTSANLNFSKGTSGDRPLLGTVFRSVSKQLGSPQPNRRRETLNQSVLGSSPGRGILLSSFVSTGFQFQRLPLGVAFSILATQVEPQLSEPRAIAV